MSRVGALGHVQLPGAPGGGVPGCRVHASSKGVRVAGPALWASAPLSPVRLFRVVAGSPVSALTARPRHRPSPPSPGQQPLCAPHCPGCLRAQSSALRAGPPSQWSLGAAAWHVAREGG